MMKRIWLVGTGPGVSSLLTREGQDAIEKAKLVIGAKSVVSRFVEEGSRETVYSYQDEEIAAAISATEKEKIAVLFSGDTGFFSGCRTLLPLLRDYETIVVPGISSLSALSALSGISWEDAKIVSLHARVANLVEAVRRSPKVFVLCGEDMRPWFTELSLAGFGECRVVAGENLGLPEQRLQEGTVDDFSLKGLAPLAVCFILNHSLSHMAFPGVPDELFARGSTPMTKRDVRALAISRLGLQAGEVAYDIGAGTGSVSVELALSASRGKVYAIERTDEGLSLIKKNMQIFALHNIFPVYGEAPEALTELPAPDAVFIGGSGGGLEEIIRTVLEKNPRARVALTAITVETAAQAVALFENYQMQPELMQLSVAHAKKAGAGHMMIAQNPVYILTGHRR